MVRKFAQAARSATSPAKAKVPLSLSERQDGWFPTLTEGASLQKELNRVIAAMFGSGVMVALASRSVLPLLAVIFTVVALMAIAHRWFD